VHVIGAADYSAQFNKSAFDAGIILESLTPIRPSLEDTFFEMTGD
jgi:ABC-2 type transport system ATP-binding protein